MLVSIIIPGEETLMGDGNSGFTSRAQRVMSAEMASPRLWKESAISAVEEVLRPRESSRTKIAR